MKAEQIAELRALLEKATPGPLVSVTSGFGETYYIVCRDVPGHIHQVCVMEPNAPKGEEDAALIVAAINTLPTLLSSYEALQVENERLKEENERLAQRLDDEQSIPWPIWAKRIYDRLIEYGAVDPHDIECDLGEAFDDWIDGMPNLEAESLALRERIAGLEEGLRKIGTMSGLTPVYDTNMIVRVLLNEKG
jgi:hypothetical protein